MINITGMVLAIYRYYLSWLAAKPGYLLHYAKSIYRHWPGLGGEGAKLLHASLLCTMTQHKSITWNLLAHCQVYWQGLEERVRGEVEIFKRNLLGLKFKKKFEIHLQQLSYSS